LKYYIICGEASGDLHGSNLIKELKSLDKESKFRCWGGDLMEKQGVALVEHYKNMAFMGFVDVIKNLKFILQKIKFCKKDIIIYEPDAVILIDYPGFNLRIAKFLKQKNIPVYYYISPQVWAWKASRVVAIKRDVKAMFVILPFEKEFYKQYNYSVHYVGHPLIEIIKEHNNIEFNSIVALLPGSRKQEIEVKLPLMLAVATFFPNINFEIAKAPSADLSWYSSFNDKIHTNVNFSNVHTYDLLQKSKAAIVTSGTATLETALFGVPQVVCYKGSLVNYTIGKWLVNIKFISLVNLILDKMAVKELIQQNFTIDNLKSELELLLNNIDYRTKILMDYKNLRSILSGFKTSNLTAKLIIEDLKATVEKR
jgi:lipid-A-disaccharide synthase